MDVPQCLAHSASFTPARLIVSRISAEACRVVRRCPFALRAWLLLACLGTWLPAAAELTELRQLLAQQQQEVSQVERLLDALAEQPAEHHDAILFRLDERLLSLLADLDAKLGELAAAADAARDSELRDDATGQIRRILDLSLTRIESISGRIASAREEVGEFEEGVRSTVAESFIQEQQLLRMRYLQTLVSSLDLIEALVERSDLGAAEAEIAAGLRPWLEEKAELLAERTVGQIRLDSATLLELRGRQAEDPLDEELGRAVRVVQRKQTRSLNSLDSIVLIADQLGLDTADYRALILQQRGLIGVEILQRQVFMRVMRGQLESLQQAVLATGPNLVLRTVIFLLVLAFAWLLARAVRVAVRALLRFSRVSITRLTGEVLISVSGIVVIIIGILMALAALGVSVTPMLAGLGIAGIILGLALQDSLSNLASGAMILIYQPYDVDDHVRVGDVEGIVKKMNLVATTITTFDNQVLVVPNKNIWGDNIINHTASQVRRVDIEVAFSYDEDIDFVEQVLMEEMQADASVLSTPEPAVHIGRWDDSAVTMMAKAWVATADYWPTLRTLTKRFKQRFDAEGISIPFPQRDVHLYDHGTSPEKPRRRVETQAPDRSEPGDAATPGATENG